jgi:hypothetical protein
MVAVPENAVTEKDIADWYILVDRMKKDKASEMLLRTKIFKHAFPAPTEGTNTAPFTNGFVFKGTYKLTRDIDEAVFATMAPQFFEAGINPNKLIRHKPELAVTEYRKLTAEQQKLVDQALVIKPGAPSLEIVKPASKG